MCAVPSSAAFCSWLGVILSRPKVFRCFVWSLGITPRAPMTTGTTVAFLSQSRSTSIFRSWYLVIFSTSFCWILLSQGIATSTSHTCFFSTTVMSGMLCARCLSVWILKSQRILASFFCSTYSILCSHHLSAAGGWYFLLRFQCSIEATLLYLSL